MEEINGMLTAEEILVAEKCLEKSLALGADKVRITLNKSLMELFGTLNGELDKVSHCLDRSISVCLFVDGKFGSFSTNRLVESELDDFLKKAIATVRMLAEDPCRDLPDPSRTAKNAVTGKELGLYDETYPALTSDERLRMAIDASIFKMHCGEGLISEEGEYSDSIFDSLVLDSNGLRCRHTETSFEYGVEVTVQDADGNRFSSYWWDATPMLKDLNIKDCGEIAFKRAMSQIGPVKIESGKYSMVELAMMTMEYSPIPSVPVNLRTRVELMTYHHEYSWPTPKIGAPMSKRCFRCPKFHWGPTRTGRKR